jgi:hypothetical protein
MKPSLAEVVEQSEVLTLCKRQQEFESVVKVAKDEKPVIDLVRVFGNGAAKSPLYDGICW